MKGWDEDKWRVLNCFFLES